MDCVRADLIAVLGLCYYKDEASKNQLIGMLKI